jgi:hypothetical protein
MSIKRGTPISIHFVHRPGKLRSPHVEISQSSSIHHHGGTAAFAFASATEYGHIQRVTLMGIIQLPVGVALLMTLSNTIGPRR